MIYKLLTVLGVVSVGLVSCSTDANKEETTVSTEINEDLPPLPHMGTYRDKDSIEWDRNNIYAPRENESINDPEYKKRVNFNGGKSDDPYQRGYNEGYNDALEEYGIQ